MTKFLQTTNHTITWFKKSFDANELEMKPPFQRNPVWTHAQKSYLIDTILNGFPVPELYMQEFVDELGNEKHVVIDGQQRLRACLEFVEGGFSILEKDSPEWADMKFDELSPEDKKKIYSYTFIIRVLPDIPDEQIRGIFQRLNRNVVALNLQELRQATYWGPFIQTMQEIANYSYWSSSGLFTPLNIRRMMDVEYVSEVSIAVLHGYQNKKETIDKYYQLYEEEFDQREDLIAVFHKVLGEIEQVMPDIKQTRWRKKSDFYTLFTVLAGHVNSLPLTKENRQNLRHVLVQFGTWVDGYLKAGGQKIIVPENVRLYAESVRASSDLSNRRRRGESLEEEISSIFSEDANPMVPDVMDFNRDQEGLFTAEIDEGED